MSNQPRVAKVLAALLLSMTAGAIVLMALGNNPPSAGPFSLAHYCSLNSVEKAISCRNGQSVASWNRIEIHYSETKAGNIEQLAALNGLASDKDINCHFCLCNGLGGGDGQIQPTEKWRRQWPAIPDQTWQGSNQTIRVCIIADSKNAIPTDSQVKRLEVLVEALRRKFNIKTENIYYPSDW